LVAHANVAGWPLTLAEQLAATVITCDAKLAAASGTRCAFDLIS
jgi:hypothetical protein